jgi:DNA (cytosine-5)-methyltransferase 1
MIYGSVCSGIEAATVAWHPLGWKPAFFSEIEPFPRAVLDHHYPEVPLHGDFTTIKTNQYRPIDLLVGGTPCQSFSIAGLRGGLDDDRGNLALEFLKLAQRLRPRWVVWENVPGVLSSNGGRDFGSILAGLGEVGYGFAYRVLDAQYFGLAQRRKRVFVVGYLGDWRRAAAVLFEREGLRGDPAPSREKGQKVADTLSVGANQCSGFPGDFTEHISDIAPTINVVFAQTQGLDNQHIDGGAGLFVGKSVAMCLNAGAMGRQDSESETLIPTNRCGEGEAMTFGAQNSSYQGDGVSVDFCPTLDKSKTPGVLTPSAVRRLTPTECERLQGFPDGYTAIKWRYTPIEKCPDGPRYKVLGNSMAVPVMRWIGERIKKVEEKTKRTIT